LPSGFEEVDVAFLRKTGAAALALLGFPQAELSVLVTDDERIRSLNRSFRDVDEPTDVMAFPANQQGRYLGDVVISAQTAKRQAAEIGHSLRDELAELLVHGILHLIGYTDQDGPSREKMAKKTEEVLKALNILRTQGR